jgi:hypothetical protein
MAALPSRCQGPDQRSLSARQHARVHRVGAERGRDAVRRAAIVAGNQHGAYPGIPQCRDRRRGIGAQFVAEGEQPQRLSISRHDDHRPSGRLQSRQPRLDP